ncbi:MAG: TraB/GumN family protein [Gammaproteobacteria bacterium]|nr:TraB/GumN family protein [Gammaproteobacteria bacterium]
MSKQFKPPLAMLFVWTLLFIGSDYVHATTTVTTATTATENTRLFLWQIEAAHEQAQPRKKNEPSYLLGSIHVMKDEMYPLDPAIEHAFQRSDQLAVEVDITTTDPYQMRSLMMQYGSYDDGRTLDSELSVETAQQLKEHLNKSNTPMAMFNTLRPWMVGLQLSMQAIIQFGYNPLSGIDKHFIDLANGDSKKKIVELESIEEQIALLAADPADIQDLTLRMTLKDIANSEALEEMITTWYQGDADKLYQLMTAHSEQHPELKAQMTRLLDQRNIKMANKIDGWLKSGASYFIVIGAGHMGGESGLLKLLRSKGYHLTQLAADSHAEQP